ncbi:MAG: hypothetical protein AAF826_06765 [Pseudomonadota bacterium]
MASTQPEIAFIINDTDFVLATCHDDGFGDAFATVDREADDAYDVLRDALRERDLPQGAPALVFLPYQAFEYKRLTAKALADTTPEDVFEPTLSTDDEWLVDYGTARKSGGYTPVAISAITLDDAARSARAAGLKPVGLSSVFPKNLRTPQPFFAIAEPAKPVAGQPRRTAPFLLGGLAAAVIAAVVGFFAFQDQFFSSEAPVDEIVALPSADNNLLAVLRAPSTYYPSTVDVEAEQLSDLEVELEGLIFTPKAEVPALPNYATALPPKPEPEVFAEDETPVADAIVELVEKAIEADAEDLATAEPDTVSEDDEAVTLIALTPDADTPRPVARPSDVVALAIARAEAEAAAEERAALGSPYAVLTSSVPSERPPGLEARAIAIAVPATPTKPAVSTASVNSQDAATTTGRTLSRNRLSLIGVFGRPNAREAMFRTSSGRFVTRKLGESINTWQIVAIGADQVRLAKGSRTETLRMPE